jgi:23S rRNA (guanosine2251-2'-O)-methyltransferase
MGGPQYGGAPGQPRDDDESSQMREIAAYERRQRQPQRGQWRGPGGGLRPQGAGPRPQFGARPAYGQRPTGGRPWAGGPRQQRYQDMVRRATAGPRTGPTEEGGEPISGPHAVLEALRAGRQIRRVYVAQERGVRTGPSSDVIREAQERRVQVRFVDRIDVDRLSPGVEHQGVVAIAEGRPGVELDEFLVHLDTLAEPPLLLIIDSLQDPQNFGVLLRSAEGAGVDGVVIPRHRQVGLTPAVARTSAGASEHLLIADVANLRQAIDALKEKGVWVVGTDDSGEIEWDEVDYRGATAIVVGGEGEGIRRLVLEGCDQVVRITMRGKVASLNAAAAGTVVLFEALRQRMRDAAPPQVEHPPREREEVPPPSAEGQEEQDELPTEEEAPAEDLLRDEPAPVGEAEEQPKPTKRKAATKRTTTAKRTTRKKTAEQR